MIIKILVMFIDWVLEIIFLVLPAMPQFPSQIYGSIEWVMSIIRSSTGIIFLLIRPRTFIILLPLVIVIQNIEAIYKLVMFFIRKIPFINVR